MLNISKPGNGVPVGTMRSLKIRAKVTSGEDAGKVVDVVVVPVVRLMPIPDPDPDAADHESNRTIVEGENDNNSTAGACSPQPSKGQVICQFDSDRFLSFV
jgi:hypothetical protein